MISSARENTLEIGKRLKGSIIFSMYILQSTSSAWIFPPTTLKRSNQLSCKRTEYLKWASYLFFFFQEGQFCWRFICWYSLEFKCLSWQEKARHKFPDTLIFFQCLCGLQGVYVHRNIRKTFRKMTPSEYFTWTMILY